MTQPASDHRFHLGFLLVIGTDTGYVGGLLVTNHLGRPLEFQCTTPVRPNRTQEILYGATLQPFLYSELLGKTLCDRLGVKPQLVIVRQPELLELRRHVDAAVLCLAGDHPDLQELPDSLRVTLGRQSLLLHQDFPEDREAVTAWQSRIPGDADMAEPLERVNDALRETIRSGAA